MTTLVKAGNTVGIDSRITENGIVLDDEFNKYIETAEHVYFFVGNMCNFEKMKEAYFSDSLEDNAALFIDTTMLVLDKASHKLTQIRTDKDTGILKVSPITCHLYCVGSGRKFAYGALHALRNLSLTNGELVRAAINAASQCDLYTGGVAQHWPID